MAKKSTMVLVSALMAAFLLAGCAGGPTGQPNASADSAQPASSAGATDAQSKEADQPVASGGYDLPLSTTGEKLTILAYDVQNETTLTNDLPVYAAMKKATGVEPVWELIEDDAAIQLRLAAAVDLPDIVRLPAGSPAKYIVSGVIVNVTEVVDKYMAGLQKWFASEPNLRRAMSFEDGAIYVLPQRLTENDGMAISYMNSVMTALNRDWMDAVGIAEEPETISDLYQILKAFVTQDPNGNGQQDEQGFATTGGTGYLNLLAESYGFHLEREGGWYPDDKGVITYEVLKPLFKDLVKTTAQWYKDGLLCKTIYAADAFNADLLSGKIGAYNTTGMTPDLAHNPIIRTNLGNPNAKGFFGICPPRVDGLAVDVEPVAEGQVGLCDGAWHGISKDCKNVDLAAKWLDYVCFSDEGRMWNEYGVEGVSYEMKGGKPVFYDSILHSDVGMSNAMLSIGSYHSALPQIMTQQGRYDHFTLGGTLDTQKTAIFDAQLKILDPYFMNTIIATEAESEVLSEYWPDIQTYVNETLVQFVTGIKDIDAEWDAFIGTINTMGIDKVTEVKQSMCDRYMSGK